MTTNVGKIRSYRLKNGRVRYEVELVHHGLNKHRLIRGDDYGVVDLKAQLQAEEWDGRWAALQEKEETRRRKEERTIEAAERTADAEALLESLENTLRQTLEVDDSIDFEALKRRDLFREEPPLGSSMPIQPSIEDYQPRLNLLDHLLPSRRRKKQEAATAAFRTALARWKAREQEVALEYKRALDSWKERKLAFERLQADENAQVDTLRKRYLRKDPGAIEEYADLVLSNSSYPEFMPKEFELSFNGETGILVVDYLLPSPDMMPTLKEVRYNKSKGGLAEKHLTEKERDRLYDSLLYQVALRTIHELYEADTVNALESIVFNGRVASVDRSTGRDVNACVLTVQAEREEFLSIDLSRVDPRECFKALRGVGSSKLHSITPVAPIIQLDREDRRFVESQAIVEGLDASTNLAAIDWEEFEHLIRELFEKGIRKIRWRGPSHSGQS